MKFFYFLFGFLSVKQEYIKVSYVNEIGKNWR